MSVACYIQARTCCRVSIIAKILDSYSWYSYSIRYLKQLWAFLLHSSQGQLGQPPMFLGSCFRDTACQVFGGSILLVRGQQEHESSFLDLEGFAVRPHLILRELVLSAPC